VILDVRVFLIEPQPLVIEAFARVFEEDPGIRIVGAAAQADAPSLAMTRPDVAVLDIDALEGKLEDSIEACARTSPGSRICVLSGEHRVRVMQRALAAKAHAYVMKDTTPANLVAIVRGVARGEYYADPRLAGSLLRRRTARSASNVDLSEREFEIVRLIADGLSNREIGDRLIVSEKTIKNHVSRILSKLKLSARAAVAVYAVRNGLVS